MKKPRNREHGKIQRYDLRRSIGNRIVRHACASLELDWVAVGIGCLSDMLLSRKDEHSHMCNVTCLFDVSHIALRGYSSLFLFPASLIVSLSLSMSLSLQASLTCRLHFSFSFSHIFVLILSLCLMLET